MDNIYIKTNIYNGENSLKHLEKFKNKVIWIICDSFLVKNGNVKTILKFIDNTNKIVIFNKVVPEPPITVIAEGVAEIKKINPQIVIGYGGGSAIDTAKGIIYFARKKEFVGKVKFIAIPTTSGTGSEVTSATVITDSETKTKHAIFDDLLLPDEAILDSQLTLSVPPNITANTGMDVLTHALEAYVSINANVYSDALAEKSVELLVNSLVKCYRCGDNIKAREKMQEASNLAGMAFNIAGLGINHSLAHQIGGQFHIPHGLANAIFLTKVIDFNSKNEKVLNKYSKLVYKTGMTKNEDSKFAIKILKNYIMCIMKIMNMKTNLREFNVNKEDFENVKILMVNNSMEDTCTKSNPIGVNKEDMKELFEEIY